MIGESANFKSIEQTMTGESANFKRNDKDNDWRISKLQKEWQRQ